jgi:hypothetical protein
MEITFAKVKGSGSIGESYESFFKEIFCVLFIKTCTIERSTFSL